MPSPLKPADDAGGPALVADVPAFPRDPPDGVGSSRKGGHPPVVGRLGWAVGDETQAGAVFQPLLPIRHYGESTRREVWASGGTRSPFRLAVAIFSIPTFVRLVRGNTLALKRQTFVEAARSTADRGIPFGAGGLLPKVPGFLEFPLSHNAFYIM